MANIKIAIETTKSGYSIVVEKEGKTFVEKYEKVRIKGDWVGHRLVEGNFQIEGEFSEALTNALKDLPPSSLIHAMEHHF